MADYQAGGGISEASRGPRRGSTGPPMASRQPGGCSSAWCTWPTTRRRTRRRSAQRTAGAASGGPPGCWHRFVAERLITLDTGTAQITHDALLTAWPRLRPWIETDQENLRIRRRVSEAARAWAEAGRDTAALLRGGQLAVARDWAADPDQPANLEHAGPGVRDRLGRPAEHPPAGRTQPYPPAAPPGGRADALVLVTIGLTGYAFAQREAANAARNSATAARDNADSREVAIEAAQERGQNVALAAQLSLAAYRIAGTPEARASLLESPAPRPRPG